MEENIYEYLKLSPRDNESKVRQELEAQIKKWTNQLTRQADRAKAKLAVLNRFKAELDANPNLLREHADKYESLIKQKRLLQEKSIREDAAIFVVNGQIEESALAEMVKKNSSFTRDEILKIIGATVKQKKTFKYKETGSGKEMDQTLFKRIAESLAKVNKRDLYDFLSVPPTATAAQISQICDSLLAENQRRPATDEKATISALIGYCKTRLLDPTQRADYDYTCGNQIFADVRSKIERIAAGSERVIRPEQYRTLMEECTNKGMNPDKAEFLIYKTADTLHVTIVEPESDSMQMCRFCGTFNDKDATVCKRCGLPIIVTCPQCGRVSTDHDELRCVKCGFVIGNFPRAEEQITAAETALKYNNVDEAVKSIENSRNLWPTNPRLGPVINKIKKAQDIITATIPRVKALCAKRAYYEAATLLNQIGFGSEATALRAEIDGAVANVQTLLAKAQASRNANEQIECYMQALSICSDCTPAKDKLKLTPPTAPGHATATVTGSSIRITWEKLPSRFIQYYVLRKAGSRPSGPTDGEVVCETMNDSADDTNTTIGTSYYYAVYSKCSNVYSTNAAITTSPVMTVADINTAAIALNIQETQIGFGFKLPNNARSIEIYRDGKLIKDLSGSSFVDTGLIADRQYTYKFITVYADCMGKQHKSAGVTQTLSPMAPPKPVKLTLSETSDVAELSWSKPSKGMLCIYESDTPFKILENNKVNIDNLKFRQLSTTGTSYKMAKDFSGVKYFLPVTVQGNIGVAGAQVQLISIKEPSGIRFDRNETYVMAYWSWSGITAVRISVCVDGGRTQHYDISSNMAAQYKVEIPKGAKAVSITIASKVTQADNSVLLSKGTTQIISLKAAKVSFEDVKSESLLGFIGKDNYSLKVSSDAPLPCALELLIAENFPPTNLVNYRSYLTISPQELQPGKELRKEFRYTRTQKGKPVYFRLIAADRGYAQQINIIPETRQIK